ncbi:hypothetical protein N0V90_011314 [Kalmusia sp. IMI 367209]|nr:hypothetical protein N0V90_011314 [Kalmusia sp. IMI 367209]
MSPTTQTDGRIIKESETMPRTRLIDRDQRVREKPMRVLVLGLCRTGTSSIRDALQKLGYTTHHMTAVIDEDPSQIPYWNEAVQVTYFPDSERPAYLRGQPPYGRAEFDKLLAKYDAVTDFPCALYAEQLVKAYPDAKVILTNRDYKSWERSMEDTIWWLFGSKLAYFCRITQLAPWPLGPFLNLNHWYFQVHNGNHWKGGPETRAAFDRHYAHVRSLVPKENLLEFGPKFEWEPLCGFLGKEVPEEPYPWANEGKEMKKKVRGAYVVLAVYAGGWIGLPVVAAWAVWRWQDAIMGLVNVLSR